MPDIQGTTRPQQGGYRANEIGNRHPRQWDDDYRIPYGSYCGPSSGGYFRRLWSPPPYQGGRQYDGQGMRYGDRGREYDSRHDYMDRRDSFYEGRGRDFDMRDPLHEDQRRYEERRYERRPPPAGAESLGRLITSSPAPEHGRSSRFASSSPPSSSKNATQIVAELAKPEGEGRRPLFLNKAEVPTGRMTTMFQSDIVSFVKDMNPTEGWEGQTTAAKDRLMQRLMHDYEFYGESTRLSDKYLKKKAGIALTQFRYNMNQLIDKGGDRPSDFNSDYWKEVVRRRSSAEAKQKSIKMASIARGRSAKNTTKKALEQAVIVELAKGLGREPLDKEIEEAVEKEWAAVQEEAADKKRLRVATAANTAAVQSNKDMENRLLVLEAFIHKWEPEMEKWKEVLSNASSNKVLQSTSTTVINKKSLAVVPLSKNVVQEDAEEKGCGSSENEEDSDKSKSSGDRKIESDSDDDDDSSGDDVKEVPSEQPVNVVEPADELGRKEKDKKNTFSAEFIDLAVKPPMERSRTVTRVGGPSSKLPAAPESKSVGYVGGLKASEANLDVQIAMTQGKEKEVDTETHSRKKQKVVSVEADDEGQAVEEAKATNPRVAAEVGKTFKVPRRHVKPNAVKQDSKGGKDKAVVAKDMMLIENTEPRKFLGVGSMVTSDFDRDVVFVPGRNDKKLVRLRLKRVIFPNAPLAYVEVGDDGLIECKTLGEAFLKERIIWWPAPPELYDYS